MRLYSSTIAVEIFCARSGRRFSATTPISRVPRKSFAVTVRLSALIKLVLGVRLGPRGQAESGSVEFAFPNDSLQESRAG